MNEEPRRDTLGRADGPTVRLVYVMGGGRSGSTLLDTILGNHPLIQSTGELCNVLEHGWVAGRLCACGCRAPDCPYWTEVRRRWAQLAGVTDESNHGRLVAAWERRRLRLGALARQSRRPPPALREYLRQTGALYRAIAEASGQSILVDSSKRRSRAVLLSTLPGIDLRVVHLVRDPRGVAWSRKKSLAPVGSDKVARGRPVWQTAMYWNLHNRQSDWVRRRLPPEHSLRVRYEDLVTEPQKVLDALGRLIGVDFGPLAQQVVSGQPMQVGHLIGGNRMRMAGSIRLRADTEWMGKLSLGEKLLCRLVTARLINRYDYATA